LQAKEINCQRNDGNANQNECGARAFDQRQELINDESHNQNVDDRDHR